MELDKILMQVEKPARYTGGEMNMVIKENAEINFVFSYPDTYEIGMSHLGGKIIYHMLNKRADTYCQRAYAPWIDMEAKMREHQIPLFTLETAMPVAKADIWGFTLQYELSYTNILNMLDMAGVPLYSKDRTDAHPIIIAGGPCAAHAEPIAPFIDAFLLGDGEDNLNEFIDAYSVWKKSGASREAFFVAAAKIEGCYVPSLYEHIYSENGKLMEIKPMRADIPQKIKRRIVADFENSFFPTELIVPYIETVHDRIALEIFRGCSRGCRFCQAGYLYRPVRERSPEKLVQYAKESAQCTGYEEISLSSLSSGDYSQLAELSKGLRDSFEKNKMSISLPSLRIDSFDPQFVSDQMRKSSLTFAPEAGSQRLRDIINKNVTEEDLLRTITAAYNAGYTAIKLYFMIGLPFETDEDVQGIAHLAEKCVKAYKDTHGGSTRNMRISVSTSVFVPKPFTPFQWCAQENREVIEKRQQMLASALKRYRGVDYRWHDNKTSMLEAVIARGGREIAQVIHDAWKKGARMDGWSECFRLSVWREAFEQNGMDMDSLANKGYAIDAVLPWDSIDIGVSKDYFIKELEKAENAQTTQDCRGGCTVCGLQDFCNGGCV